MMFKNWNLRLKMGVSILVFFSILSFIVPLFSSINVMEWNTFPKNLAPSLEHFLGTTSLGQDVFFLLANSTRNSLIIGIIVALIATSVGVFLGLISGFVGGIVDRIIMILADTFIVIPSLPILILFGSISRGRTSVLILAIILSFFNWAWPARQVRSMVLSLRERDFIDTARFSGYNLMKILIYEILPFIVGWAAANFVNTILVAIAAETGLAILGLSSNSRATLGVMLYWAIQYQALLAGRWLWIFAPIVAITLIFVGLFMSLTGYQSYFALKRGR